MRTLSQQMHRTHAAALMITAAALYLLLTVGYDDGLPPQGEQGLCLPPPALWPLPRWCDMLGGIALNALMLFVMALINKAFNVLRSNTRLQLGLFAIMSAAVPRLVLNVNSGILLALGVNVAIFLLFSCYDNPGASRRVFLAFLLMSVGAAMQYSFVVFVPVMWVVTAQMRIFSLRTFMASVFGLLTPWIILLGFGIVGPGDIHLPEVYGIFSTFAEDSAEYLLIITVFISFMLFVAIALNLSRTIAYNARARAFNGALTVTAIVSIIAITVNYNNLLAYLPLLNVCAAYQITHWFVNHRFEKQYIAVLTICFIFLMFYVWRMFL